MAAASMLNDDEREARSMLAALFGAKEDDANVVLFRLNPARSSSFSDIDAAATFAAGQTDVWVHVGLTRRQFSGGSRPKAAEIDGICGIGADIDIADPVHKKPGLPPDMAAARAVIAAIGLPHGLLVHSGHGLQAWWPFAEPWMFDDEAERRRAAILLRAFGITVRERAKALGYTIDMVFDLPRLMRLAGTVNGKATPVDVQLLEQTGQSIAEDDILGILLSGAWEQAERDLDGRRGSDDTVNYGDLVLDPAAEPPWDKLDDLRDFDPQFDQAWRRKQSRRSEGWSASEWDMALASRAASAGWSRQEIADLMIAGRRKHGDRLRLDRQDYYRMTIDKATAGREEAEAIREAVATVNDLSAADPSEERSDAARSEALERISKAIGVEISRVTRSRSEPPVFGIETPFGNGSLGGIESIVNNRRFRMKVAEITNHISKKFKDDQWDTLAQGLLELAELEELGVETTLAGRAETLVSLYLGTSPPQEIAKLEERNQELLGINLSPFIGTDGRTRIFSTGFKVWLAEVHRESLSAQEIGTMLRAIGATSETRNFRIPGRRTTRSLWALPSERTGDE